VNGGSPYGDYKDAAEGNRGFMDDSDFEDVIMHSSSSLWDE